MHLTCTNHNNSKQEAEAASHAQQQTITYTHLRMQRPTNVSDKIYIEKQWVVDEYLSLGRCKSGAWKKESTREALKCRNIEPIIDYELNGNGMMPPPDELTLEDSEKEGGGQ